MLLPKAGFTAAAVILLTIAAGCSRQSSESAQNPVPADFDVSRYLLSEEPAGAMGVIEAREKTQNDEPVVLVARIGGSKTPWIDGRAAFMVIDAGMILVADGTDAAEGEICLDSCCASLLTDCTTLVKIVDAEGKVVPVDARQMLKADVNDMIVIRGKITRDEEQGTFAVLADGVHVRR